MQSPVEAPLQMRLVTGEGLHCSGALRVPSADGAGQRVWTVAGDVQRGAKSLVPRRWPRRATTSAAAAVESGKESCYTDTVSPQHATAEVFWTAFQTLSKAAKEDFLARVVSDSELREDLLDLGVLYKRRSDKVRPFAEYLAERSARK